MSISNLKPGLYIVSTPIGNLKDITLRALETLKQADTIYCEDTRVSKALCSHYGIKSLLRSYHDHNAETIRPKILSAVQQGGVICLISDAGTPLISDPGYKLVQSFYEHDLYVTVIPGASALTAAVCLSGLPTLPFTFIGFVDSPKAIEPYKNFSSTLVGFVGSHKVKALLKGLRETYKDYICVLVKEITKIHEQVIKGSYDDILTTFEEDSSKLKGEFVIFLSPPKKSDQNTNDNIWQDLLKQLLDKLSLKDAVEIITRTYNLQKHSVYKLALTLKKLD